MLVDAPVTFPAAVHTTTTPKNTTRQKIMGRKLGVTALIKPIYTSLSIKMKTVKLPCIQNSWALELHMTPLNSSNNIEPSSQRSHIANQNSIRESRPISGCLQGCMGKGGWSGQRIWQGCGMWETAVKSSGTCYWGPERERQLPCPSHASGTFFDTWQSLTSCDDDGMTLNS